MSHLCNSNEKDQVESCLSWNIKCCEEFYIRILYSNGLCYLHFVNPYMEKQRKIKAPTT